MQTGKNHGVYRKDTSGNVGRFLHKQTVQTLTECGAVDAHGRVDIDTGAVLLSPELLRALYSLVDTPAGYDRFVNPSARLSFYADFLYPLASESTLEQFYLEKPEGSFTEELRQCRTALWEVLSGFSMKLIRLSPASFIHFGTTRELLHLLTDGMEEFRFLGWSGAVSSNVQPEDFAVSNSFVSPLASIGSGSYLEDSRILLGTRVGKGCVISGVTLAGQTVPDGTVLHGLKLRDGRFVCRRYGVGDNPKESTLFGRELGEPLWTAALYPVRETMEAAAAAALAGESGGELVSLQESFQRADVTAILPWQENLREQIAAEAILECIDRRVPADEAAAHYPELDRHTVQHLLEAAQALDIGTLPEFSKRVRIYHYLWRLTGQAEFSAQCFGTIRDATLRAAMASVRYEPGLRLRADADVHLPVRVNWGGGWSDTPPYCMENGGTVLNAAVSLNGRLPISVSVKRLNRPVIALSSTDIGSYQEFVDMDALRDCRDPSDPFALHKAALLACGVIPAHGALSVDDLCARLGAGLAINTSVAEIPKGSGLGTSSILAGACVKALYQAMGQSVTDEEVFERALCMEQLMSTGGGWQDQVVGIVPGIKMVTTAPGLAQKIVCTPLQLSQQTLRALNERFALIYTGQRRLARNLLRDVVGRYIGGDAESVQAHENIQRLAVLMRFELEKGNIDGFAKLLTEHWQQSLRIDAGSTNLCIDQIFATVDDLIAGKMICGAGGGGFLQVVLRRGVSKEALRERLSEVFQESGVDVWDCEFV